MYALWPDSTYCDVEDLEEYLSAPCALSDDYEIVEELPWELEEKSAKTFVFKP